jgi:hypothetical protein
MRDWLFEKSSRFSGLYPLESRRYPVCSKRHYPIFQFSAITCVYPAPLAGPNKLLVTYRSTSLDPHFGQSKAG